ncbi:MAG: helix-hairpin-helix domain-containing protein [Cyclobacteriaceae bacterium]
MQRLRLWIRNVFGFSKSETNGFLILLPLLLLVLFSYPIYQTFFNHAEISNDAEQAKIDSLLAEWDFNPTPEIKDEISTLFNFDPNTATKDDFKALDIPPYLSDRIINYRSKGGSFRKPEDLRKIYGMDSLLFERLLPFIRITIQKQNSAASIPDKTSIIKKNTVIHPQDLNLADTSQLKLIRGIGTVLAGRIVKYRNALGGFVDQNQIKEVYGLDTTVVKMVQNQFYIDPKFRPSLLNINSATESELSNHPYIRSKIAKSIVAYRFQHGSFNEITDLLKIDLIDQTKFDRIRPYLTIE